MILVRFLCLSMALVSSLWASAPLRACELALVLSVDVSASISSGEYSFQMQGLADALDDPIISGALINGQIALAVVQWSGAREQELSIPWHRMQSRQNVDDFATTTRGLRRKWFEGFTAIGSMLAFVAPLYSAVPDCRRLVLDVSGDGLINAGVPTHAVRDVLLAQGVTINGVAIDRKGDAVLQYFRTDIIGGSDAFVLPASGYGDYPRVIHEKLFRELIQPSS